MEDFYGKNIILNQRVVCITDSVEEQELDKQIGEYIGSILSGESDMETFKKLRKLLNPCQDVNKFFNECREIIHENNTD